MPKNPPESMQHDLCQRLNRHALERWPHVDAITVHFCQGFAYVAAELPGEKRLPLCRLRYDGGLRTWGFALYLADNEVYRDQILPSGLPEGSPEEALDCAGDLYLSAMAPVIRVPAGLVVLVGPPASGKTSFVRALIERRQIDAEAVVSSDAIRAELFGMSPMEAESDAADALIFETRDRRIIARLSAGRTAVAESTNVTSQARARLIAIAGRFNVPVTMLRFDPDVTGLLQQYTERGRTDLTAAEVRAYAAVMARDANADQLRSEGAMDVYDVPGRCQATTPTEAAARFFLA
ncbi:ATP-binding protein [Actinomadura luteofluorescens]|uniref:ATP-binding protein n=1 Tax=Actinomadura luteofluorescens TaxID=46163 RepID=UPI0030CF7294